MPTPTYDLIASNVLSSPASSVTFSSIPATYRDLVLVTNLTVSSLSNPFLRINSDNGNNYNYVFMYGDGSAPTSGSALNNLIILSNMGLENSRQLAITQFLDYSVTDKHKTILIRAEQQGVYPVTNASANRWANTAAINTISLNTAPQTFAAGDTFYLYGIVS